MADSRGIINNPCRSPNMSEQSQRVRRSFNEEFKRDAVNLVVKQNYSFKAAAGAVNVSLRSLQEWHEKYAPEPDAFPFGQENLNRQWRSPVPCGQLGAVLSS